jgi:hypothetical protein
MKTREEIIKALSETLATVAQVEKQVLDLLKDVVANEPSKEPIVSKPIGKRGPLPGAKYSVSFQRRLLLYEDDLRRLHAEGLHITGIAREIGIHRDTVSCYLKEMGITPNRARGKNLLGGRVGALAPTEKEQNENLKQNPWETTDDS